MKYRQDERTDDMFSAAQARDEALNLVSGNSRGYVDQAIDQIRLLYAAGTQLTGEDIRQNVEAEIGKPHHHNAWGAIIMNAARRGIIRKTGEYRQMKRVQSHARVNPVYEVTI